MEISLIAFTRNLGIIGYFAYFWAISDLGRPSNSLKTEQIQICFTSFHYLLSIIVIKDVSAQYTDIRLDFPDLGPNKANFDLMRDQNA